MNIDCTHVFDGLMASAHTTLEGDPDGEGSFRCSKCGLTEGMSEYLQKNAKIKSAKRRQHILNTADDLMGSFLYYGRKEDENLPRGAIEEAIKAGEVTVEELLGIFEKALRA